MSARPWFVVLEGLDGTGKSTVASRLAELGGAEVLATPQAALLPCRDTVERVFPADSPSQTVFYAACVLEASRVADRAIRGGRSVVCDRYWASTVAYATAADRWLDLDGLAATLRVPDL